jgi:hypothetical protein
MRILFIFIALAFFSCSKSDNYYLVFKDEGIAIQMKGNHDLTFINGSKSSSDRDFRDGYYYDFKLKYHNQKDTSPFSIMFEIKKIMPEVIYLYDLSNVIGDYKIHLPYHLEKSGVKNMSSNELIFDAKSIYSDDYILTTSITTRKDIIFWDARVDDKLIRIRLPSYLSELEKSTNTTFKEDEHVKLIIDVLRIEDIPKNSDKRYCLRSSSPEL